MATATPEALRAAHAAATDLLGRRRVAEAIRLYERMAFAAPDVPWVRVQLGVALLQGDDSDRALRHFQALTDRFPTLEDGWQGLGKALYDRQRCAEAVAAFDHAATLTETPARALYHRGMAHLLAGDFAPGWRDYEHRLAVPEFRHRVFAKPRWDGSDLAGRRLLVTCEQGYGDVFQFVRFLPRLRDRCGDVVFECPAELREVLAPVLAGIAVVPLRGREAPDTAFDCYISLASLPFVLGIGLADIPPAPGYLAPPGVAAGPPGSGLKVGVCWAGKPSHPQDLQRSMDPECLAPLASVPGVTLVSLQKDPGQRPPLPGLCPFLVEPPVKLVDFMATAGAILAVDLVISVDTSVAHLAGALGRPAWLLLSAAGEWRWLIGRTDSPWYPTMRIFRQSRLGDWSAPIAAARTALAAR